ncbi:hypothetical protein PTKIN_Ptkin11bG0079900 [Pterospermum kingtungense]
MASSNKPKHEEKKKKKSNSSIPVKQTKRAIKKPDKKDSTKKKPNKSTPKPKPDNDKNKRSNGTPVKSKVIAKNVKPNKRKKVEENEEEEEAKMCRFPVNRIKRIIKSEDSRMAVPQDVIFLVNKATEKFLERFCKDGYKCSLKDRKKSLSYKHLSIVVRDRKRYDFLSDYVPEKIKAEDALKENNLTETGAG